jgi:riboflavin biosynthesis pyrimidine reductase
MDYRTSALKRLARQPLQIIVSRLCDFSFAEPIFQRSDLHVLLLTTAKGEQLAREKISKLDTGATGERKAVQCNLDFLVATSPVNGVPDTLEEGQEIDFCLAFQRLKEKYKINYLDISCGGKTIAHLLHLGLLDEVRLTLAGQIAGPFSSFTGQPRPRLFPLGSPSYEPHNSPLISWKEIHTMGSHLIFLRGVYIYRHLPLQK